MGIIDGQLDRYHPLVPELHIDLHCSNLHWHGQTHSQHQLKSYYIYSTEGSTYHGTVLESLHPHTQMTLNPFMAPHLSDHSYRSDNYRRRQFDCNPRFTTLRRDQLFVKSRVWDLMSINAYVGFSTYPMTLFVAWRGVVPHYLDYTIVYPYR